MKRRKSFNNAYFFDTLILMYLYKKNSVSTDEIEGRFGYKIADKQNVNNVVSNRRNSTSFVEKGYMDYDEKSHTLTITKKGVHKVRSWFMKTRG